VHARLRREGLPEAHRRAGARVELDYHVGVQREPEGAEEPAEAEIEEASVSGVALGSHGDERRAAALQVGDEALFVLGGHLLGRTGDEQHLAVLERRLVPGTHGLDVQDLVAVAGEVLPQG
jgi:hypothetical protein